jgi:vacuolar-type H+-ATPase subunit E/Vma4
MPELEWVSLLANVPIGGLYIIAIVFLWRELQKTKVEHKEEIAEMKKEHREDIQELKESHKKEIESWQGKYEDVIRDVATLRGKIEIANGVDQKMDQIISIVSKRTK